MLRTPREWCLREASADVQCDQGPAVHPHPVQFVLLIYPFSIPCAFNGV